MKNYAGKVLVERTDNGIIVSDINEENTVTSKMVYQFYYPDGLLNFETMAQFFSDLLETLKFPTEEDETNSKLEIIIESIDPDTDSEEESDSEKDDDDD